MIQKIRYGNYIFHLLYHESGGRENKLHPELVYVLAILSHFTFLGT